jgi:type IV pilus assembly protein PilB
MSTTLAAPSHSAFDLIVKLLQGRGLVDPYALREARQRDNDPSERMLVRAGLATEEDIARAYADYLAVPIYLPGLDFEPPAPELCRLLPEKLCRDHLLVPIAQRSGILDVAFVTPSEFLIIDEIQLLTGLEVSPMMTPQGVLEERIEAVYAASRSGAYVGSGDNFEQVEESEEDEEDETTGTLMLDQPPPPGRNGRIIRMVNQILEQAIRSSASDIHLEPFEDACRIRLRIDGKLQELPPLSRALFVTIVSRFKILAKMDIAEKRLPQDGAIALKSGEKRIDLRVNTMPTVYGEKMVMRLLDKSAIPQNLSGLGFDTRQETDLVESIRMPHGLMLVTGPTGSGKSTTIYTCFNLLNEPFTNI